MTKRLTPEIKAYLIDHYATTKNSELAMILGVPENYLRATAKILGLTKNPEIRFKRNRQKELPPREIIVNGASMIVRYNA